MEATPFRMTPDVIREVVEKHRPGAYVLGHIVDGRFVFQYVGRSDYCVQTRLLTHEHLYDCSYFIFRYARDRKEAFETESKWWHDCRNNGVVLFNRIHPDSPAGEKLRCPYCQFGRDMRMVIPSDQAS